MNLRDQYERFYREAQDLNARGQMELAAAVERRAAAFLDGLSHQLVAAPEAPESADILLFLADRESTIHPNSSGVESQIHRAIAIREAHFGANHPKVAEALTQLADFYF